MFEEIAGRRKRSAGVAESCSRFISVEGSLVFLLSVVYLPASLP